MAEPTHNPASSPPAIKTERVKEILLPAAVLALEVSADDRTLFAACQDGAVYAVDAAGGEPRLLGRHESYASGLALLRGGAVLVSGGYDGVLQWHDVAQGRTIRKVKAHEFWSWDLDATADGRRVASVSGRYEVGGYRYEPAPEREPSVRVFDAATGEAVQQFAHVPPVQAVAFTPDGRHLAAGNLMGEVRVWELSSGKQVAQWTNPDLTSWGVIKSHHFLGGVFAMTFDPTGEELYVCGMGPMRDPMAGNGVQRWQRFAWREGRKLDETHDGESGQGLMEALAFHPSRKWFAMGGRLFQGQWNLAVFETATGKNLHAVDAKHRITALQFSGDGGRLFLAKFRQQERKKDDKWPPYGSLEIHSFTSAPA